MKAKILVFVLMSLLRLPAWANTYPADTLHVYDTVVVYDTIRIQAPIPSLSPVSLQGWGMTQEGYLVLQIDKHLQAKFSTFLIPVAATISDTSISVPEQKSNAMQLKSITFATWLALGIQGLVMAQSETGIRVGATYHIWEDWSTNILAPRVWGMETAIDYTFPLNDKHLWFRTGFEVGLDFPGDPVLRNTVGNPFTEAYKSWADHRLDRFWIRGSAPAEILLRWNRFAWTSGVDLTVRQGFGTNAPAAEFTFDVSTGFEVALTDAIQFRANYAFPINPSATFVSEFPSNFNSPSLPRFIEASHHAMRIHAGIRYILPDAKKEEATIEE